jgi:glyoxylase-like metal-dependent hydrolase (beta-lactamase superfamily II)
MGQLIVWDALNGNYAWSFGGAGPDKPSPDGVPSPGNVENRKFEMALTPHGWAKAAMAANPTMEMKTIEGQKLTAISFMWEGKRKITGYVDSQNLLTRVETMEGNDMLGDVTNTISYSNYKDFSGIKFPTRILQTSSGDPYSLRPVLDVTVTKVQPNAAIVVDVPESIRQAGTAGAPAKPQSGKVAEGIWAIYAGGTQSEAIDFGDYSVVVEASGNEARSLAVISETKRLIPDKPIRYIVNSHHHLDHSSGIRTFVAEGATIITADINQPFYEAIFKNPRTIKPDKLAQNPKPANFITVKDKYVLTNGDHSLVMYRQTDQMHDQGLLLIYSPKEKVLFPSDSFMLNHFRPGTPGSRSTVGMGNNLLANLDRLKLDVEQIVPVHTFPGTFAVPFNEAKKRIAEHHGDGN